MLVKIKYFLNNVYNLFLELLIIHTIEVKEVTTDISLLLAHTDSIEEERGF